MRKSIRTKIDRWHIRRLETKEEFWIPEENVGDGILSYFVKTTRIPLYSAKFTQTNWYTFTLITQGKIYTYEVYELKKDWLKSHYPYDYQSIKVFD
jgi:hypothetical protein